MAWRLGLSHGLRHLPNTRRRNQGPESVSILQWQRSRHRLSSRLRANSAHRAPVDEPDTWWPRELRILGVYSDHGDGISLGDALRTGLVWEHEVEQRRVQCGVPVCWH